MNCVHCTNNNPRVQLTDGTFGHEFNEGSKAWMEPCAMPKFGHHPDPVIDAQVELDRLEGLLSETHAGLLRALDYRAATPEGLAIKADIRNTLERTGYKGDYGYREKF